MNPATKTVTPEGLKPGEEVAGMFIADPAKADAIATYALGRGGQVKTVMGFRFITLDPPDRTLWKLRLIGRLEYERRQREARKPAE